jgi:hypothetical protein
MWYTQDNSWGFQKVLKKSVAKFLYIHFCVLHTERSETRKWFMANAFKIYFIINTPAGGKSITVIGHEGP